MAIATQPKVPSDLHKVWRQALDATRGALILTDARQDDNPIVYANQAFLDLTGYSSEEVMGRNCRFLQGSETEAALVTKLRRAVRDRTEVRVTLRNYRKDGTMFWNDLLMSPILDETGTLTHFVGMQLDITERIDRENALRQSRDRLKQSNRELEQFTYAASHDLQEPLRMVKSFMELLGERYSDKIDDDGHSFMKYAMDGAVHMQKLIDDLLELSRVRTKARPAEPVPISTALQQAMTYLHASIKETGARITYDTTALPVVMADKTQLVQLLQNLLGNAIKYRQPGKQPDIKITAKPVSKAPGWTAISIKDNGIGIAKGDQGRIFELFQRLHTREEYPGSGVGLSLCRQIVERHGGDLTLTSAPGEGSTFRFTLPMTGGQS